MAKITLPSYMVYTLIIGLLAIVVIFVFAMNDGNQCLSNPLVYGAKKATSEDTGKVTCSCDFVDPKYQTLYFDEEKMSLIHPLYEN